MFAMCELPGIFHSLSTHVSRGELYGLQIELTRDLFDVCKTMTDRGQRVALPSI